MPSIRNSGCLLLGLWLLWWAGQSGACAQTMGKRTFVSTCAGCHGLDGRGSERAPSIATSPKVRRSSDQQVSSIISNGIPGTGMPAFHSLNAEQVRSIVSYLRTLQGKSESVALPGNPRRGEEIFVGKGDCSACHSIAGRGGFLGPDLTDYGAVLSSDSIRQTIISSNRNVPPGYRTAVATKGDGSRVEGILRNEDNFSVQLQAKDGSFHFLQRSEIQKLEYVSKPLMPTNYADRLSPEELNDLVSYLMSVGLSAGKVSPRKHKEGDLEWVEP